MRSVCVLFSAASVLVVLAASVPAQVNRDDLTPLEISYTTRLSEDRTRVHVTLDVDHVARPTTHLAMPNWTPGAYGIGRYGERVEELTVLGGSGGELAVTRLDHQTWSVDTEGVRRLQASYSVPARRRSRGRGQDPTEPPTGVRISGPSTYLYVRGAKQVPVTARYEVPAGWRVANGLLIDDDPLVRRARDYDTFIDAPTIVGIFQEHGFEIDGTPFTCVFFENSQTYDFDVPAFVEVVRRIAASQGKLFGSFPFPNYVFLFTLPGGGGLEHLNSTSIGLDPGSMKRDVTSGASVTSHEFFHLWNVKRIRPEVLGPFEYEHENYTGNLWVSEGWTSYYGDLTLVRTGIISRDRFLGILERVVRRELNKESRETHSVYWASRNTWRRDRDAPPRVDYYGTGELLGALIDLTIRHETDNHKSLDDVMRFFNRWFAEHDVGFEEGDVERACTAISNHDFTEFFARHVFGTLDPPLQEILAFAGITYEEEIIEAAFPFEVRSGSRGMRISGRPSEDEAEEDAPRPGDVILSLDGEPAEDSMAFLKAHRPGDTVHLAVQRGEREFEAEVTLIERRTMIPHISMDETPTDRQLRIRESWLTGEAR